MRKENASLLLLHEGVGWAALGFALHALVDFPFHLPQLAVPGLLLMAGWGALRPEGEAGAAVAPRLLAPLGEGESATAFRPRMFTRLMGAFLLAVMPALMGYPLIKCLQGDICYSRAQAWRNNYVKNMRDARQFKDWIAGAFEALRQRIEADARLTPERRAALGPWAGSVAAVFRRDAELTVEVKTTLMKQTLDLTDALAVAKADPEAILQGDDLLKKIQSAHDYALPDRVYDLNRSVSEFLNALTLSPYNALIPMELGEVCLWQAQTWTEAARKAAPSDPARAEQALGRVNDFLNQGLKALETAGLELDNHAIFKTRAQLYLELARLHPDKGYQARYRKNLELAQYYCPAEIQLTYDLIRLLQRDPRPDTRRIQQLKRQFWKVDAGTFRKVYILPAYQALTDQRYAEAARLWEELVAIDPNCSEFMNHAARAAQFAGNRPRALELFQILLERDSLSMLEYGGYLAEATLINNPEWLMKWFNYLKPEDPLQRAEYRALEIETRRRFNLDPNAVIYIPPAGVAESRWKILVAEERSQVLFHYFNEVKLARQAMDERLALTEEPPSARFWIEGFYIAEALGDKPLMRRCLDGVRAANPQAPALPDLDARLKAGDVVKK